MRVILDTNVLISALISPRGASDLLYQAWRVGHVVLVRSEAQLKEFSRVSRYARLSRMRKQKLSQSERW